MDYSKFRLRSFTKLHSSYHLKCGSESELPPIYCSANPTDDDAMFYYYDICAIPWNRNPPKNTKCTVLRIESIKTPPGFARLMVDRDKAEDNPTYFRRPPELRDIKTGGPSMQRDHRFTSEGRAFLRFNQTSTTQDIVLAVYCPYWPVEAEEWRKRKRFNGWPNEKLIARITRGGCHFVSKLRTWSSSDDTEWRFSFSKAELLLIHSWTQDQKLAYHRIRVAKRRISEYCGGDGNKGFQTYYFKSLMLWACEEFPPEFWHKQNATVYLEILFRRLYRCLDEKFCPSYFIPECNIMSHLKDEGRFEKELQMLQIFLRSGLGVFAEDITFQYCIVAFRAPFEYQCLTSTLCVMPLSKELNGRVSQYLSECEGFLPGIRNLHAAIEAHLRLMSVDSVIERHTSKDYVVCDKNFDLVLLKCEEFELYECLNAGQSILENYVRIFAHTISRNLVPIYRNGNIDYAFYKMIKETFPLLLQSVTSAYRANFYLTAVQSYKESLAECEKCFVELNNKAEAGFAYHSPLNLSSNVPLLMCNSLSQIFDDHVRVILGFATLHRNISFSKSPTVIATSYEVCLKLDALEFLKYIYIQCAQKLYSISELTDCSCPVNSNFNPSEIMDNPDFSAVILFAALRQSRAYKNSLSGPLIPDHFGQGKYPRPEKTQEKHCLNFT